MTIATQCPAGPAFCKQQDLGPNYAYDANSLTTTPTVIRNAASTHRTTYMLLNPGLSVNSIYNKCSYAPEHYRIACTTG